MHERKEKRMKKIKSVVALTAVLAMTMTSLVMAAPSPRAGVVSVVVPGSTAAAAAEVKTPTTEELTDLADFISESLASLGQAASVKTAITIVPPADYKGGSVPVMFAAAGLKDGAQNVFAYIRLANGEVLIVPCVVNKGHVGFVAPAFGTVAIVEVNPASQPAAGATLH